MCCKKHQCFITLQTTTNSTQISLPDSSRIRNGKVTSIMLRRSGTLTLKSATGATLASDATIGTASIVVKDLNGNEITAPLPLSVLQRDYNSPEPLAVNWASVDLTQTTITIIPANATDVVEIIFGLDCDTCKPYGD